MFSYGELLLMLGAAVALFGPKDIPIVARAAGRFVGKAVGYIQSARGQLDDVMKRSQVDQVHKELRETMAQLEAIRHEIRSGMSISNPGPLTRSVLNLEIKPDAPASPSMQTQTGAKESPNLERGTHIKFSETLKGPVSDTKVVLEMQELHRLPLQAGIENKGFEPVSTSATTVAPLGFQPGPDGTFNTMPASTGRIAAQRLMVKPVGVAPATSAQFPPNSAEVKEDITVLPISAVSAGLLPPRTGPLSGGADLVLESLTERKVAFDTLEFFQRTEDPTLKER
ncbi:unnamed protein product [Calypogeia fissa]